MTRSQRIALAMYGVPVVAVAPPNPTAQPIWNTVTAGGPRPTSRDILRLMARSETYILLSRERGLPCS